MTRRRRPQRRQRGARPASKPPRQAPSLADTAELIREELRRRGVDLIPLAGLPATLGVTDATLQAAVDWSADLGIGGPARRPVVWRVDPAPLAAGLEPVCDGEGLTLHLAAADPNSRPLVISGRHLDPTLAVELDPDGGTEPVSRSIHGELGYALARLVLMSTAWLSESHELFSLISRAWRATAGPVWSSGRLRVYCADLGEQIATQFWQKNAPATQLELVVWAGPSGDLVLVNVYPCIIRHLSSDPD